MNGLRVRMDDGALRVDAAATREIYRSYVPTPCECSGCRNFWAVFEGMIYAPVADSLARIGVDVAKPCEVMHVGRTLGGGHTYLVEWPFIGTVDLTAADTMPIAGEPHAYAAGVPEPVFDQTGRRCSVGLLLECVRWGIAEAEPE